MKTYYLLLFTLLAHVSYSQQTDYNIVDGKIANGYDVVSYFDTTPVPGNDKYVLVHDNAIFTFKNNENREKFKANPNKYIPQYGGWCAYAMAKNGDRVAINPETYEIRSGKLYLFYNAYLTNTLKSWLKKDPELLITKADKYWNK